MKTFELCTPGCEAPLVAPKGKAFASLAIPSSQTGGINGFTYFSDADLAALGTKVIKILGLEIYQARSVATSTPSAAGGNDFGNTFSIKLGEATAAVKTANGFTALAKIADSVTNQVTVYTGAAPVAQNTFLAFSAVPEGPKWVELPRFSTPFIYDRRNNQMNDGLVLQVFWPQVASGIEFNFAAQTKAKHSAYIVGPINNDQNTLMGTQDSQIQMRFIYELFEDEPLPP